MSRVGHVLRHEEDIFKALGAYAVHLRKAGNIRITLLVLRTGLTRSAYYRFEQGAVGITLLTALRVAGAFNLSLSVFFNRAITHNKLSKGGTTNASTI